MSPYKVTNREIVDNYCTNLAISKKIGNTRRFGEKSNWHTINNQKNEIRSDRSKHDIH